MRLSRKSLVAVSAAAVTVALVPGAVEAAPVAAAAGATVAGTFFSLAPSRVLDTRSGNGAPVGKLGANSTLHLQVAGRGGVPSSGVSAVVLNVTVANPTTTSFISVYPTGIARPNASNLNISPGWVGANSVTVPVGTGGQVDIWNQAGSTDVIADVTGFYAADASVTGTGGQFFPLHVPSRAIDTREVGWSVGPGESFDVGFNFWTSSETPATVNPHIRAVTINLTAVNPTGSGFLTAWSGVGSVPNASTLNFTPGKNVPNMAITRTRACDEDWCDGLQLIRIQNTGNGNVDVIVDVLGFYDDGTLGTGLNFEAVTPTRITDTRIGQGIPGVLRGGSTNTDTVPEQFQDSEIYSLSANATGVNPTASTFIAFWPNILGLERPLGSTLNLSPGEIKPNATVLTLANQQFNVFNLAGNTHLVVDVSGVFRYFGSDASASARTLSAGGSAGPAQVSASSKMVYRLYR